jgi:hypothetical protein
MDKRRKRRRGARQGEDERRRQRWEGVIETTLRYLQTGRCSDLNACWSVGQLVLVNLKF